MAQTKRNSTKSKNSKNARLKREQELALEREKALNRKITVAVVLGMAALFLLANLFIRGENLWDGMRSFYLGFFGWTLAILIPLTLIYTAYLCIADNEKSVIKKTAWLAAGFLFMLATLIFTLTVQTKEGGYGETLKLLYENAPHTFNSGLIGGLLGKLAVNIFSLSGARVIAVFGALLLLCLTVGINIIAALKKRYEEKKRAFIEDESLSEIDNRMINGFPEEEQPIIKPERRRKKEIDIPVDEEKPIQKKRNSKIDIPVDDAPENAADKQDESDYFEKIPIEIFGGRKNRSTKQNTSAQQTYSQGNQSASAKADGAQPHKRAFFDIPLDNEPSETDYAIADGGLLQKDIEIATNAEETEDGGFISIIPEVNSTSLNNALTRTKQPAPEAKPNNTRAKEELQNNAQLELEADGEEKERSEDIERLIDKVTLEQIDNKPKKQPIEAALDEEPDFAVKRQVFYKPPISMFRPAAEVSQEDVQEELRQNAEKLVEVLRSFGIETRIVGISRGPSVTRYELQPAAGVKISRITSLADDLALGLAAISIRIEAPIPGRSAIGIEIPNHVRSGVSLREILESDQFKKAKSHLTVCLGRDITGKVVVTDLAKMPHLLIAGTTGSGKSVTVQCMIQSILYNTSPDDVKILLIDPKRVEFKAYNGIPNLLVPVVTEPRKAAGALGWAVTEMLKRYNIFADNNVRDIYDYNELAESSDDIQKMPQILIVVDEFSDLMMTAKSEVEDYVCRLAQMARAAGMHLVIATQRPSTDVITGLIKANIPSRLALSVSNNTDSRVILDQGGAEKLLGNGDMLFSPIGSSKPTRIQGCYISIKEINDVTDFLRRQQSADYDESVMEEIEKQSLSEQSQGMELGEDADELLPQAIEIVLDVGEASATLLQRRLRLGYARAGRLVDTMEQMGIVGPHEGSKPRKVLISRQEWQQMKQGESQEATL